MQDVFTGRMIGPENLTGMLVHTDETWCIRSWQVDMRFVKSVAGVDHQKITVTGDAARAIHQLSVGASGGFGGGFGGAPLGMMGGIGGGSRMGFGSTPTAPSYAAQNPLQILPQTGTAGNPLISPRQGTPISKA